MTLGEQLIKEIDKRIELYMKRSNFICEYPAIVVDIIDSRYVKVQLPAKEAFYKVPVREGLTLSIGDSVFIKCRANDFTNAIVTDRFMRI